MANIYRKQFFLVEAVSVCVLKGWCVHIEKKHASGSNIYGRKPVPGTTIFRLNM